MKGKSYAEQIIHWRIQKGIIPRGKTKAMQQMINECVGLNLILQLQGRL